MRGLTVRRILEWKRQHLDLWLSEWIRTQLSAELLFRLIGGRREVPPLRPPEPGRPSIESLEHACLGWLKTGRWECTVPWRTLEEELESLAGWNISARESVLAFSTLLKDDPRLADVRHSLMELMPNALDELCFGEMLFLTGTEPSSLLEREPEIALGWIYAICVVCTTARVSLRTQHDGRGARFGRAT